MTTPLLALPRLQRAKHSRFPRATTFGCDSRANSESSSCPVFPSRRHRSRRIINLELAGSETISTSGTPDSKTGKHPKDDKRGFRGRKSHHRRAERELRRLILGFWYLESSIRYILRKATALFYNELSCDAYDERKGEVMVGVDPYFSVPVVLP